MDRKLTLVTMTHGNPIVLKETFKSFSKVCDEIICGDLCLFEKDSETINSYKNEFNLKVVKLPFNMIFHQGFASVLNFLIQHSTNDLCVYSNCSEIIKEDNGINRIINENPQCNTFYFDHETDKHRWYRMNDRRFLSWSGVIHEECTKGSEAIPYHKPVYRMADLEKDMYSSFLAKVMNDAKEIVYFNNYLKLVDDPKNSGATNIGWTNFVKNQYGDMKQRLLNKGKRYEAFCIGDLDMYLNDVYSNKEFEKERFESSDLINFQGNRKIVL